VSSINGFERNTQELFRSLEEWIHIIDELKHVVEEQLKGFRDEYNRIALDVQDRLINDIKNQQHEIKTQLVEFQDELGEIKIEIKIMREGLIDKKPD